MIPLSDHNEALAGDTLYSAFLNHEWREIVLPFIVAGMEKLAAGIEDETERQTFENRYGAMIDDFYNEDIVDGTPVGTIVAFIGLIADIPNKWLLCNGTAYLQADYPDLSAILKPAFKSGANFFTPNLAGHYLRGAVDDSDHSGESGANSTTLTIANLPAHSHTFVKGTGGTGTIATSSAEGRNESGAPQTTSSVGSGTSFSNEPLHYRFHWIIKALP
jgi:microcystin-dependent protein